MPKKATVNPTPPKKTVKSDRDQAVIALCAATGSPAGAIGKRIANIDEEVIKAIAEADRGGRRAEVLAILGAAEAKKQQTDSPSDSES